VTSKIQKERSLKGYMTTTGIVAGEKEYGLPGNEQKA
jgi:hypothetical protein